jgi:hypothetical protein
VTNAHWHQNRYAFQAYSFDHFPADFEIKFAPEAIDNGADVFVAQGVHTLKGVEIYNRKPIFYGTSNFIFQSSIMPAPLGKPRGSSDSPEPDTATQARALIAKGVVPPELLPMAHAIAGISEDEDHPDAIVGEHDNQGFWQLRANLEAILTESHFENAKLTEVRIYPVDLGLTPRPGSQVGIPRRPAPEVALKILDEIFESSEPFGTHISVEDRVGVIRLCDDASSLAGQTSTCQLRAWSPSRHSFPGRLCYV